MAGYNICPETGSVVNVENGQYLLKERDGSGGNRMIFTVDVKKYK